MKQLTTTFVALSLLSLGCRAQNDEPAPGSELGGTRQDIVGGQATDSLPAVGALVRFGGTHCTGTLVAPRKVLTAAHCLEGVSASSLSFATGPDAGSPKEQVAVQSIHPHPAYDRFNLTNDIGYVTLVSTPTTAQPMDVLRDMDASFEGRELVFVGYGASNGFSQSGSGTKRFVVMPVAQVRATTFTYAVNGKNTCNGDSGGPAFAQVDGQLVVAGVTSYGDANCVQYGVDTRVDTYLDFLELAAPAAPPPDPCEGETFEGRCDGDTVVWCEDEQVQTSSCASQDEVCGYSAPNAYYGCLEPPEDPCDGETYEGRCDGDTVVWCENEEVKQLSCPGTCGFDAQNGFYNCM